ncbi:MAG: carboxymuconolactone decarboxylase family protein [Kiritimatiellia bacterium]
MDATTKELVALAAAIAGKCQPCFAYHYKQAQELGIPDDQLREAIQLAKDIRASGDKHMDEFASRRKTTASHNTGEFK